MIKIDIESLKSSHQIAYVCSHVFENTRPVLYVCREDGDWQFLCGGYHEADEIPRVVGLGHLIEKDETLAKVINLETGFEAERQNIEDYWIVKKIE